MPLGADTSEPQQVRSHREHASGRPLATSEPEISAPAASSIADPIAETIDAIVDMEQRAERNIGLHQRYVEHGTALVGRPAVLYALVGLAVIWVAGNLTALALHRHPLDEPPFYWLQGTCSFCGVLIALIVLITQNRQGRLNERRAQLDLQVNLLNEQKLTKIIELIVELRRDLPNVVNRHDPQAEMMTQGIDTQTLMEAIEVRLEADELLSEIDAETP